MTTSYVSIMHLRGGCPDSDIQRVERFGSVEMHEPVDDRDDANCPKCLGVPTVGTEPIPIATVFRANEAVAEWLVHLEADGSSVFNPDTGSVEQWSDTTSEWTWMRLGNGDLFLGCFPQADAYDVVAEQVERDYNDAVFEESLRTIEMTEEDRA